MNRHILMQAQVIPIRSQVPRVALQLRCLIRYLVVRLLRHRILILVVDILTVRVDYRRGMNRLILIRGQVIVTHSAQLLGLPVPPTRVQMAMRLQEQGVRIHMGWLV